MSVKPLFGITSAFIAHSAVPMIGTENIFSKRSSQPTFKWFVGLIVLFSLTHAQVGQSKTCHHKKRCKYSVRDVGFVSVHAFTWQLTLAKPSSFSAAEFERLNSQVAAALKSSNVHYLWVDEESSEWKDKANRFEFENEKGFLFGVFSNSNGEHFKCAFSDPNKITSEFSEIVSSSFRDRVLSSCAEALCTIVLVESGQAPLNAKALGILNEATSRLEKQMWELEKPTDKPPQGFVLSNKNRGEEKWFLTSLGIDTTSPNPTQPVFAILYGQGRRMGELIPLSKANVDMLVGRAAVCGGDCECELDRDWLYGHQIAHQWNIDLEKKADETLTFDPMAAYVRSEVAAIVRKPGRKPASKMAIDLGPGLIIHDLEPLEMKVNSGSPENEIKKETSDLSDKPVAKSRAPQSAQESLKQESQSVEVANSEDADTTLRKPIRMPGSLVVVLLIVVGVSLVWSIARKS